MRNLIFVFAIVLSGISSPASAYSVGVEYQSTGSAVITNIYDVQIGEDFYNVSFDGSFGSSLFLGDETGALLANNAIIDILNMTFEQYPPYEFYFPPVGPVDSAVYAYVIHYSTTELYGAVRVAGWLDRTHLPSRPYVEPQFAPVPEPSSAVLAGIGLVWLAIRGRLNLRTHGSCTH